MGAVAGRSPHAAANRRRRGCCDVLGGVHAATDRWGAVSGGGGRMVRLTPGVDASLFRPSAGGDEVRERWGLGERPVVVCVSRLMRRKGQDTLIEAFPALKRRVPEAALLIVGGGPDRGRLEKLALASTWAQDIVFTGSVPWPELPAHYAAGDVFAMPCRTRRGGLDVEGLGIVYLEASATGLPVLAGDSGGAPDAVLEGATGFVVSAGGGAAAAVVERLGAWCGDAPGAAASRAAVGAAGRRWVEAEWSWGRQVERLRGLAAGV